MIKRFQIDNLFKAEDGNSIFKCTRIDGASIDGTDIDNNERMMGGVSNLEYKDVTPIPLTEEWLLKWFGEDGVGCYAEENNMVELFLNNGDYLIPKNRLQYVHQLQNLYFALTGEELTLTT